METPEQIRQGLRSATAVFKAAEAAYKAATDERRKQTVAAYGKLPAKDIAACLGIEPVRLHQIIRAERATASRTHKGDEHEDKC